MRKPKTLLPLLLACSTALAPLSLPAPAAASGFTDLSDAATWAQESILSARNYGFMTGDPSGTFRPAQSITRAEVAVILTRVLRLNTGRVTLKFSDVPTDHWANRYIAAVQNAGLMSGDGANFRPGDSITREELAVLLVKATGKQATSRNLTVADWNQISPWAHSYVAAAMEFGLLSGDGTNFNPKAPAQRQAVAVTVMNLSQLINGATINTIEADKNRVVIDGISYEIDRDVKALFSKANYRVLQSAKIRFTAKNRRIISIQYLEIVSNGEKSPEGYEFTGNAILHGGGVVIDGHVVIRANYVTVADLEIKGDLEITEKHQAEFYADSINVHGQTIVAGAGGCYGYGSKLGSVRIKKDRANVRLKGSSKVNEVSVLVPYTTFTSDGTTTIPAVTLSSVVQNFETNTSAGYLSVQGTGTKVTLTGKPLIEVLTTTENRTLAQILDNYTVTSKYVIRINGTVNPAYPYPAPPPPAYLPPVTSTTLPGPGTSTSSTTWPPSGSQTTPPATNTPPTGTSTVTGHVSKPATSSGATLTDAANTNVIIERTGWSQTVTTDANGNFSVSLSDGTYTVRADWATGDYADSTPLQIQVVNGTVQSGSLTLVLQKAFISGLITDPQGNPVRNAVIEVVRGDGSEVIYQDTADSNGRYAIPQPAASGVVYLLKIKKPLNDSRKLVADDIAVTREMTARTENVQMREDLVMNAPRVWGTVYDTTYRISVYVDEKATIHIYDGEREIGSGQANDRYSPAIINLTSPPRVGSTLRVVATDAVGNQATQNVIVEQDIKSVQGTVYKASTKRPEDRVGAGVLVWARPVSGGDGYEVYTDANGHYSMTVEQDGDYELVVYPEYPSGNGPSAPIPVSVTNGVGTPSTIDVVVPPATAHASGTFRDENGNPIPNLRLTISGRSLLSAIEIRTNAQGQYSVSNLPNDYYTVTAWYGNYGMTNLLWLFQNTATITRDYTLYNRPYDPQTIPAPTVDPFTTSSTYLTGTALPNSKVFFTYNMQIVGYADVGSDGKYRTSFLDTDYLDAGMGVHVQNSLGQEGNGPQIWPVQGQ